MKFSFPKFSKKSLKIAMWRTDFGGRDHKISWSNYCLVQVPYGEIMGKTLVFAVYDFDRFSKHDAIGEVRLPVCQMDLASHSDKWKDLQSIVGDGVVSRQLKHLIGTYFFTFNFEK